MANAILTLTDPAGIQCSSELPWETYALLVGTAQRSAHSSQAETPDRPHSRSTPSDVAVAALEQTILRRIDDSEGMHANLLEEVLRLLEFVRTRLLISVTLETDINHIFARALASGIPLPGTNQVDRESRLRWRVYGVVSYNMNNAPLDATMVIDMQVTASDWHAAENAALDEIRAELGLDASMQFSYTWRVGPTVTPLES